MLGANRASLSPPEPRGSPQTFIPNPRFDSPHSLAAHIKQISNGAHSICMLTRRFNFQQRPVGDRRAARFLPHHRVVCVFRIRAGDGRRGKEDERGVAAARRRRSTQEEWSNRSIQHIGSEMIHSPN